MTDTCTVCGATIPEGRGMVCAVCNARILSPAAEETEQIKVKILALAAAVERSGGLSYGKAKIVAESLRDIANHKKGE